MNHSASETAYKGLAQAYDRTNNKMIFDSKVYGSTDNGTTWNPVKTDVSGNVNVVGTVGIATTSNTVKLDQTLSNNTVKIDSSTNTVKIDQSSNGVKITDGTHSTTITQCGILNNRYGQDVYVQNSFSVNDNTSTGINVYNISTKKSYIFSGYTTQAGAVIVGYGGTLTGSTNFSASQTYYAWSNAAKTLVFKYIDSSLTEQTSGNIGLAANTWTNTGISALTVSNLYTLEYNGSGTQVILAPGAGTTFNQLYGLTDYNTFYGVITCPNYKAMRILNIYFYSASTMRFHIMIGNASNRTSKCVYTGLGFSNSNITFAGDGIVMLPGEYVYLLKEAVTSTEIVFYCTIVQENY